MQAAAIEARKAGAKVVVLEKMPTPGGNSIINGGAVAAAGGVGAGGVEDFVEGGHGGFLWMGFSEAG